MNKYLLSFVVFGLMVLSTSCRMNVLKGEGKKITDAPAVTPFNAVEIDISLKAVINVQEGTSAGVQLNGYENLLKHIKTKVENNTLRIYSDLDKTWTMDSDDVTATITVPSITLLKLTGAPDADMHGNISGNDFKLDISGASTVKIDNVNVDNFSVDVSGAANIEIKGGTVKHAQYEVNGAGDLKAFPLQSTETTVTISGAGTSHITALQKLTANISGAGTIKYKGHPTISQDVSGAGTISDVN